MNRSSTPPSPGRPKSIFKFIWNWFMQQHDAADDPFVEQLLVIMPWLFQAYSTYTTSLGFYASEPNAALSVMAGVACAVVLMATTERARRLLKPRATGEPDFYKRIPFFLMITTLAISATFSGLLFYQNDGHKEAGERLEFDQLKDVSTRTKESFEAFKTGGLAALKGEIENLRTKQDSLNATKDNVFITEKRRENARV